MIFNFAIVGGGLTGTAMLYQFVDKVRQKSALNLLDPSQIKIQIFEKQDIFGPGFPHCDRNVMPFHITNMCAKDMGIVFGNPADFHDWVENNRIENQERFPYLNFSFSSPDVIGDQCIHYPRAIMGEYLKTRFQEAVQIARNLGLEVDLYSRSEVTHLKENYDKIHLTVKHLSSGKVFSMAADRVLLATGHWFEKSEQNNYFPSPWPAKNLLQSIPKGEKVAVMGTSLSAIEVVLTLTSDGKFIRDDSAELVYVPSGNPRKITLYSRKGLLPKVRGKMGTYKNKFLTRENVQRLLTENNGNLTLEAIFQLLNSELEEAYGHPIEWADILNPTGRPADLLLRYLKDAKNGDGSNGEIIWQTVVHKTFSFVRELYLNLTLEDRKRFDREYTTIFFTHAATQPIINAEKLLAVMRSGMVEVLRLGEDYRFVRNDATDCFEFIYRDLQGDIKRDVYRYVVNARGQEKSLATNPSTLVRNLLNSGTVQIEEVRQVDLIASSDIQTATDQKTGFHTYKTGSIWIDPKTHHILRKESDGIGIPSNAIYAVGAMTRGQIIDASMGYGIARSTAKIADDLVEYLTQVMIK
jgi:uncharacterized NAD(P)/FAD-binding protein YdhS